MLGKSGLEGGIVRTMRMNDTAKSFIASGRWFSSSRSKTVHAARLTSEPGQDTRAVTRGAWHIRRNMKAPESDTVQLLLALGTRTRPELPEGRD